MHTFNDKIVDGLHSFFMPVRGLGENNADVLDEGVECKFRRKQGQGSERHCDLAFSIV